MAKVIKMVHALPIFPAAVVLAAALLGVMLYLPMQS